MESPEELEILLGGNGLELSNDALAGLNELAYNATKSRVLDDDPNGKCDCDCGGCEKLKKFRAEESRSKYLD